jgi:AraC-like DNA-binding protein
MENTYSFSSNKVTLNWLKYISVVFILTYFSLIIFFLLDMGGAFSLSSHYIPAYGLTIISFSLGYYGLMQPYFSFKYDLRNNITGNSARLDQSKAEALKKKLSDFLEREKPYLEPELSIQQLADAVKIPRHSLTQIINEEFNKNFFTFINEYRVQEAQYRLADPQFKNDTVLSIGLSSGFNSKSSFNALFKQYTDMTPSQYRSQHMGDDKSLIH